MHLIGRIIGRLVEAAAGQRLDDETRSGNQVLAVAIRPREAFVRYRGAIYVFAAADVPGAVSDRMLSMSECRVLFGGQREDHASKRLAREAFVDVEIVDEIGSDAASVRLIGPDGETRVWMFGSRAAALDLVVHLRAGGAIVDDRAAIAPS